MSLQAPKLDDRTFQDLVDDAKRYIMERCEVWTDHNVSDPGVTLVEAFAWMTDLMLYRLNRVPERTYLKFLEMIGVTLRAPAPARVDVDFRLSASLAEELTIPAYTVVSSERVRDEEPVLFTLFDAQTIKSASSERVAKVSHDGDQQDMTSELDFGDGFKAFSDVPMPGDGIYLGFNTALDRHLVLVEATVHRIAGHNIDPANPPLEWQISTAEGWVNCEMIGGDNTSGFNETGWIELALPEGHANQVIAEIDCYWLRCRVNAQQYRTSPELVNITASTIGIVANCVNAVSVESQKIGEATEIAGQEIELPNAPIVSIPGERFVVTAYPPGTDLDDPESGTPTELPDSEWSQVDNFADSTAEHKHVTLDSHSGILRFGPQTREADGSVRQHGALPQKGSVLAISRYWQGGGARGNVTPGTIRSLRSSVPHISTVRNRHHGRGGVDAETVEEATKRGPLELRARNRAVTAEDFEYLALGASSEVCRAKCVEDEENPGVASVRVLIVPATVTSTGPSSLDELEPSTELLNRVATKLDGARLIGTTVRVEPPEYVGVAVDAAIQARPDADLKEVEAKALQALYTYFNPTIGGDDGTGWPFGRAVRAGDAYSVLQRCPGVDVVEDVKLFAVELVADENGQFGRTDQTDEGIGVYPNELVVSGPHVLDVYHGDDEA